MAVFLSLAVGTIFVAAMIAASGNDIADFAIIVIGLAITMMPVFMRVHQHQ